MPEPVTVSVILGAIVKKVFETLAGKTTEAIWDKLKGDPARKAFQQALGNAIRKYASSGTRLAIASPLWQSGGPLEEAAVAAELAELLRFERQPDARLIGARWKDALDDIPQGYDFTAEANQLLGLLAAELRSSEVFRPAFQAGSLKEIADHTAVSAETLQNVEQQLASLQALLSANFGHLIRAFSGASFQLRDQIRDFTRLIEEKTSHFVGRQFVFDAIERFCQEQPRGYFFVRGNPGIGKTAFAAQLVKTQGCVHHFNVRAEGINRADTFLRSVCAQLTVAYGLEHDSLPFEATQDAGFLNILLGEVSDRLSGKKALVVVDALDEVDTAGIPEGANPLYLPMSLPTGIYIVVTSRKDTLDPRQEPRNFRIDCEQETLYIESDSAGNIADIREYIGKIVSRPGIQSYIATQGIDDELFVDYLVEKSQGNFMYLHYVLPEIERGAYKDLSLEALPTGLRNYYEDHWRRMKGPNEEAWFTYKLGIVMALTVVKEAVSVDLLEDFSRVHDRWRIRNVLEDWAQFLEIDSVPYEGINQERYRIYHASFHDFIAEKEGEADERVSRKEAHKKIADTLWEEVFGNESSERPAE